MLAKTVKSNFAVGVAVLVTVLIGSQALFPASTVPTDTVLAKLFPDLENPRLMTLKDLPSEGERVAFKEYGYSFMLNGDFNRDNVPDQAIAGHFENPHGSNDVTFVAILTKRKGQVHREFFYRPQAKVVLLKLVPHPDKQKAKNGYKAVLAQFTGMPSDDYAVIYWTGTSYRVHSGFDTERWEGYFR